MDSRLALFVRCSAARPSSLTGFAAARSADLNLTLRLQLVGPFDHDLIAFVDAAAEDRCRSLAHGHLHGPHVDALVLLDDVDVRSLRSVLDRRRRYGQGVAAHIDLQLRVDELVRKESAVAVVEDGLAA